jgi:hypothetical protein
MAFTTGVEPEKGAMMISPRRVYLTSDRQTMVEHGDPRAAFLLVGEGCEIDIVTATRYGLVAPDPVPPSTADPVAASPEPETTTEPETPVSADPEPQSEPEPAPPPKPAPSPAKPPVFKKAP